MRAKQVKVSGVLRHGWSEACRIYPPNLTDAGIISYVWEMYLSCY